MNEDQIKQYGLRVAEKVRSRCELAATTRQTIEGGKWERFTAGKCAEAVAATDLQAIVASVAVPQEKNTQQPVAYMTYKGYLLHAADPKVKEHSNPTPLFDFPPVPRDVLMSFGKEVHDAAINAAGDSKNPSPLYGVMNIDLAAIADRYASKVQPEPVLDKPASVGGLRFHAGLPARYVIEAAQRRYEHEESPEGKAERKANADKLLANVRPPEPVNQQLLAALEPFAKAHETWNGGNAPLHFNTAAVPAHFRRAADVYRAAIAAEAAPPVVHDGYAQGVEAVAKMLEKKADDFASENGYDDMGSLSFGGNLNGELMRDYHSGLLELAEEVRAMKTDCQQPASAQPVAVPDERAAFEVWAHSKAYSVRKFESGDYYYEQHETGCAWDAWQARAMLSAAQKGGAA